MDAKKPEAKKPDGKRPDDQPKDKAVTPLVGPYDEAENDDGPEAVATDAPVSTNENGEQVPYPDLGGRID